LALLIMAARRLPIFDLAPPDAVRGSR
jgi:hypothetical protein